MRFAMIAAGLTVFGLCVGDSRACGYRVCYSQRSNCCRQPCNQSSCDRTYSVCNGKVYSEERTATYQVAVPIQVTVTAEAVDLSKVDQEKLENGRLMMTVAESTMKHHGMELERACLEKGTAIAIDCHYNDSHRAKFTTNIANKSLQLVVTLSPEDARNCDVAALRQQAEAVVKDVRDRLAQALGNGN